MRATTTISIPSADVPAAPSFEVEVPSSWRARAAPGAVVAFDVPGRDDWSVVVSTLRIGADQSLRDVAVRTFARQRAMHPGAAIRSQRTGRFDDRITYLRDVTVPGDAGPTTQLHALFSLHAPGDAGWADVMSVVATCPDGDLDELGPPVIDLVASFRPTDR